MGSIGMIFMALVVTGAVFAGPASAANPPPSPYFHLVNGLKGFCLSWVQTTNVLEMEKCSATDHAQFWYTQNENNGFVMIRNYHNGRCIAPAGGATGNVELITYNCTGSLDEFWLLSANYWGQVKNLKSGNYMGIKNADPAIGAHAVQWSSYPTHADQMWAELAP